MSVTKSRLTEQTISDDKTVTECSLCASTNLRHAFDADSNADGSIQGYSIKRCDSCGAGITSPIPAPADLPRFYDRGVYEKSGGRANAVVGKVLSTLAEIRLREIAKFHPTKAKLLDVGCGKGRFVYQAAQRGWQADGTDTSRGQVEAARQRYNIPVIQGEVWEANIRANEYDVVTSWHVLEHLQDPNRVVQEIHRVLKPGGIFICEVPNLNSWQAKIGHQNWFQLEVPRHLIHYTPEAMSRLLAKHGFEVVAINTFSFELGPFGMLQSILNRTHLPPNALFQWLKMSNQLDLQSVVTNLLLALLMAPSALLLELTAIPFNKGGVLRTVARTLEK